MPRFTNYLPINSLPQLFNLPAYFIQTLPLCHFGGRNWMSIADVILHPFWYFFGIQLLRILWFPYVTSVQLVYSIFKFPNFLQNDFVKLSFSIQDPAKVYALQSKLYTCDKAKLKGVNKTLKARRPTKGERECRKLPQFRKMRLSF